MVLPKWKAGPAAELADGADEDAVEGLAAEPAEGAARDAVEGAAEGPVEGAAGGAAGNACDDALVSSDRGGGVAGRPADRHGKGAREG
jgi:hypothetical protein